MGRCIGSFFFSGILLLSLCLVDRAFCMQQDDSVAITFYLRVADFFDPAYADMRADFLDDLRDMQHRIPESLRVGTTAALQILRENSPIQDAETVARGMIPGVAHISQFGRPAYVRQFRRILLALPEDRRAPLLQEMVQRHAALG